MKFERICLYPLHFMSVKNTHTINKWKSKFRGCFECLFFSRIIKVENFSNKNMKSSIFFVFGEFNNPF